MSKSSFPLCFFAASVAASVLLPAQASHAVLERYGNATPSTVHGAPVLWVNGTANVGVPGFGFVWSGATPLSIALTGVAFAPFAGQVAGLELNVDPSGVVLLAPALLDAAGGAAVPLPLPAVPALAGLELFAQGFALDAASASPLQLTASRGLRLRLALQRQLMVGTDRYQQLNDPAYVIDLIGGGFVTVPTTGNALYHSVYSRDGTRAYALDRITARLLVLDMTASPPIQIQSIPLQQQPPAIVIQPTVMRLTPDGDRLLIGVAGSMQPAYALELFDVRPSSPTYLQSLGTIPQTTHWVSDMRIHPNGTRLYVLAAFASGVTPQCAEFSEVDIDPASSTYGTTLRSLQTVLLSSQQTAVPHSGRSMALAPDARFAYLGLWGVPNPPSAIAVIDLAGMTQVDCDLTTPWLDNIPMTSPGHAPGGLDMDLLGEELYVGERAGAASVISAIVADPASPAFMNRRSSPTLPFAPDFVVASPAGDALFFNTIDAPPPTPLSSVRELTIATMQPARVWTFPVYRTHWTALR
jgi:hypothetical protein